eukprot:TRINITY_DN26614_c0_g1_i1.p2 TRINITY_DN26614_c0_g1~~TRINITY_DN26614_c0_g1_i1.p2  ORF type:complete len:136 (-),score=2.25 TRINITY_DN26614_c0_g1_i1:227-634(-)
MYVDHIAPANPKKRGRRSYGTNLKFKADTKGQYNPPVIQVEVRSEFNFVCTCPSDLPSSSATDVNMRLIPTGAMRELIRTLLKTLRVVRPGKSHSPTPNVTAFQGPETHNPVKSITRERRVSSQGGTYEEKKCNI